jgi:hypothetical protein
MSSHSFASASHGWRRVVSYRVRASRQDDRENSMSKRVLRDTVQKTNAWLAEIMRGMRWNDRHRVWIALRAVLHALRDRLSVDEAIALGAQLPLRRGGP